LITIARRSNLGTVGIVSAPEVASDWNTLRHRLFEKPAVTEVAGVNFGAPVR
jgi:hypothetical protein